MRLSALVLVGATMLPALAASAQRGAVGEILRVAEWHGGVTVTETGTITGRTEAPAFRSSITTEATVGTTCSGDVRLTREYEGEWSGEVEVSCTVSHGYERVQTTHGVVVRMGHEASGSGSGSQPASLSVDPERGTYTFHVTPFSVEVTVREFMDGHTSTRTTTEDVGGTGHLVEDHPLPGDGAISGSISVPFEQGGYMGGVGGERSGEMTRTITWTLSPGRREDDVRVAIQGPACVCLDADGGTAAFTATASEGGGTFRAFDVDASGRPPREVVNRGGADPVLELAATRETGAVTLAIVYEKGGRRYESDAFPVSFCTLDEIALDGDVRDLSFDASPDGRLSVRAASRAWHDGEDVSADLRWRLEEMEGGPRRDPEEATGAQAALAYVGLPEHNGAFGPKALTARLERGACACERETEIRTFFAPRATNHPPGEGGTGADRTGDPNWFYYWLQTRAARTVNPALVVYRSTIPSEDGARIAAQYVWEGDRLLISDHVMSPTGCRGRVDEATKQPLGVRARGIDCFAELLRHEWQHRTEELEWWNPYVIALDPDLDTVPITVELAQPGCSNTSGWSCDARPFDDVPDREIFAYYAGWAWEIGAEDTRDWSCGGKQWQGGACPD